MTSLFSDFLIISVTTSLMIFVLMFLSPWLSKNYSAKWKYWIWMILTIRLLLPFNISFANNVVRIPLPDSSKISTVFQDIPSNSIQIDMSGISHPVQQAASLNHIPSLMDILTWLWFSGFVLFLLYHFTSYYFFRKQSLRWSNSLLSDQMVLKINQVYKEMKMKLSITVLISEKVPNPMLVGFYKPILFLPHDQYNDEELEFIFKHELVHYKRHDIIYKILLLIVHAIHWFNPFVWFMVRQAGREIEIYCDETVVGTRSLSYRKKYCEAILSVMQNSDPRFLALSTNFSGGGISMKERFISILNTKKKRNGITLFYTVLLLIGVISVLAACTNIKGSEFIKPGTIYSIGFDGEQVVVNDAGNSYSIDAEGNVSVSYRNGDVKANVPLKLDTTGGVLGMGQENTGYFISEDKTAIVYGFADGKSLPLHVLISNDKGQTWNDYPIPGAMGYETKFIGFTNKNDGWLVSGASQGVGSALNYVYQTSDGGKTWKEIGNPNDIYSEHLTGVGFSSSDIGFLGYRYYMDEGPVIYWTKDQGQTWERLAVSLPEKFDKYKKIPFLLSLIERKDCSLSR